MRTFDRVVFIVCTVAFFWAAFSVASIANNTASCVEDEPVQLQRNEAQYWKRIAEIRGWYARALEHDIRLERFVVHGR